jgi:cell division protein FtsL
MSKGQKTKAGSKAAKLSWRQRQLFSIIALLLWLLLSAFGYVWCSLQVVHLGYDLSKEHRVHSRLLNENNALKVELASLKNPREVERIAIHQLGLKHPQKNQIVVLP